MKIMDNTLFENPWDPSSDLLGKCYNQREWETRLQSAALDVGGGRSSGDGHPGEDDVFSVANLWGDLQGYMDLLGILRTIMIPNILLRSKGLNADMTTPLVVMTPDQAAPSEMYHAVIALQKMVVEKEKEGEKLRRLFYQEIYPEAWRARGTLERMNGTRKWEWAPLLIHTMLFSQEKRITSGVLDKGYGSSMAASLSTLSMSTMVFNISMVVTVLRAMLSTMMEDDICMQTSSWFRDTEAYWKIINEWLQGQYDDLGTWQQRHDKKGTWNQPNGKLFRLLRPFSTLFPGLSLISRARDTLDKTGAIRVLFYQGALFQEWLGLWIQYLYREKLDVSARELEGVVDTMREKTTAMLENMSAMGITNIGYEQSILWSDHFIERRMLPPCVYMWRGGSGPTQHKALQKIKNVFSILAYQRSLLLEFIDTTYPLNDVFRPRLKEYSKHHRVLYDTIQALEFRGSSLVR